VTAVKIVIIAMAATIGTKEMMLFVGIRRVVERSVPASGICFTRLIFNRTAVRPPDFIGFRAMAMRLR
jgi:hypothetical protein